MSALLFQDPSDTDSDYLLECLLGQAREATQGWGAYAWANASGVKLLLRDPEFETFLKRGPFDLVIGVDAITNEVALTALHDAQAAMPNLSVRVFAQEEPFAMFHPKAAWFKKAAGGALVIGSGNLTVGGLRGNYEAFTISELKAKQIEAVEAKWKAWLDKNIDSLRPVDDPLVVERASRNRQWGAARARGKRPKEAVAEEAATEAFDKAAPVEGSVLLAEIPKAANRWRQANFDVDTYENYFGAKRGTQRRILLRHVSKTGVLAEIESRQSVEVRSQNYRFELKGAPQGAYPTRGRPIGLFLRVRPRTFVYRVVMPGDPDYDEGTAFLAAQWTGRKDRMRRVRSTMRVAQVGIPSSPIWKVAPNAFKDDE